MKEYRICWQQCPHIQHSTKILFVEAETPEDALLIARDHIERKFGIAWFSLHTCDETTPIPAGRVKE